MKTRTGKIARLPHALREQLNQRLRNGALGPQLMQWLNALPEVQAVLTQFFEGSPINRQNLTEWRQGGYEDWLRHQEREQRIQRIAEEGLDLKRFDNREDTDMFEHSARIALAELMADMDCLHELHGEERFQRLRKITWELSRLQNAFNRSRWADLAWTKWNDRFLGPDDYKKYEDKPEPRPGNPRREDLANSPNPTLNKVPEQETPAPLPTPNSELRTPISDLPSPIKPAESKLNQTTSTGGDPLPIVPQVAPLPAPIIPPAEVLPAPKFTPPPVNPTPYDPLADFHRQMAYLKKARQPQ